MHIFADEGDTFRTVKKIANLLGSNTDHCTRNIPVFTALFLKHVYVAHGGLLSPIQTAPTRPPCRANCINCPVLDKGAELQVARANRGATPHGIMDTFASTRAWNINTSC